MASKTIIAPLLYHGNTSLTVGPENKAKNAGHNIVIVFTIHGIGIGLTVGTGGIPLLHTARAYFAPGGLCILRTTGTFPFPKGTTCATVKTTHGNKPTIADYFLHRSTTLSVI